MSETLLDGDPDQSIEMVVVAEIEGVEDDRDPTPFEHASSTAVIALETVKERLRELRRLRETTNAEIRDLVEQQELLERMTRVGRRD